MGALVAPGPAVCAPCSQTLTTTDLVDAQILPAGRDHGQRHPVDDLAHRLHRRSGLRDLGRRRARGRAVGRADRRRACRSGSCRRRVGLGPRRASRRVSMMLDVDYFSDPSRADRGPEVVAVRDQSWMGGERRRRARSPAGARWLPSAARGAGVGLRRHRDPAGSRSSGCSPSTTSRRICRAWRGARAPRSTATAPADRLRLRAAAGRRCSRSRWRSRISARRTSRPAR